MAWLSFIPPPHLLPNVSSCLAQEPELGKPALPPRPTPAAPTPAPAPAPAPETAAADGGGGGPTSEQSGEIGRLERELEVLRNRALELKKVQSNLGEPTGSRV